LKRGANVNATDAAGDRVLHIAVQSSRPDAILRALLERGPDLEARGSQNLTPLQVACVDLQRNNSSVSRLLEAGANPNAATSLGATPMHAAARWPVPNVMQKLLDHGGKIDPQDQLGNTPLHVAARANYHREVVRFLLTRGGAVNARNQRGETRLDIATGRTPYRATPHAGYAGVPLP